MRLRIFIVLVLWAIAETRNINNLLKNFGSDKVTSGERSKENIYMKCIGRSRKPVYLSNMKSIVFAQEPTLIVIGASIPKKKDFIDAKLTETSLELISMSHVIFDITAQYNGTTPPCANSSTSNDIRTSARTVNQEHAVPSSNQPASSATSSRRPCDATTNDSLLTVNITFISKTESCTYFFELGNEKLSVDVNVSSFAVLTKKMSSGALNMVRASFNIHAGDTESRRTNFGSLGYGDNTDFSSTAIQIKPTYTNLTTTTSTTTTAFTTTSKTNTLPTLNPGPSNHTSTAPATSTFSHISSSEHPVTVSSSTGTETRQTSTTIPPTTESTTVSTEASTNITLLSSTTTATKAKIIKSTTFPTTSESTSANISAAPSTPTTSTATSTTISSPVTDRAGASSVTHGSSHTEETLTSTTTNSTAILTSTKPTSALPSSTSRALTKLSPTTTQAMSTNSTFPASPTSRTSPTTISSAAATNSTNITSKNTKTTSTQPTMTLPPTIPRMETISSTTFVPSKVSSRQPTPTTTNSIPSTKATTTESKWMVLAAGVLTTMGTSLLFTLCIMVSRMVRKAGKSMGSTITQNT